MPALLPRTLSPALNAQRLGRLVGSPAAHSIAFDGASGRVTCLYVPSGSVSIAVWALRSDTAAAYCPWGTQIAGGGSGIFRLEANSQISLFANSASGGTTWSSPAAAAGVWARYLITHNGTTSTLYVNGVNQGANPLAVAWNGGTFEVGCRGSVSNVLKGNVYGVLVWAGYILTQAEATADYEGCDQISRGNLAIEWPMTEGIGPLMTDTSGHGNNGTLSVAGATWNPLLPAVAP